MKKLSVVIPAFNCCEFIVHALQSVFDQTYPVHEIIVVNDGSTDDIKRVLVPYLDRITYLEQENLGASAARNTGIIRATGDWIAFLDADDLWLPEKTEQQFRLLSKFPDVCLLYGQMRDFTAAEQLTIWPEVICETPSEESMLRYWASLWYTPPTPTVIVKKSALEHTGYFDTTLPTAEDLDLWVRLLAYQPFVGLKRVLGLRRVRKDSLTNSHPAPEQYKRYLRVLRQRRAYVKTWTPAGYKGGKAFIHTAMANAYYRQGMLRMCLLHAAIGASKAHPNRKFALKLLLEALIGTGLYVSLTNKIKKTGFSRL